MGIKLIKNNGNIDLKTTGTNVVIQGEDGGYYIPSIDENGILTWTPTKETMEAVESTLIKGEDGIDGSSGIYVGTTEPEDSEALIWINPDGEEPAEYATKEYVDEAVAAIDVPEVDLTGYATEKYVDDAVAAIPEPDLSNYATKDDIPDLTPYATVQYVDTQIANIPQSESGLTEAEIEAMLIPYITEAEVNTRLIEYATEGYVIETITAQGYKNEYQIQAMIDKSLGEVENGSY